MPFSCFLSSYFLAYKRKKEEAFSVISFKAFTHDQLASIYGKSLGAS
jgi:hypothetical protein